MIKKIRNKILDFVDDVNWEIAMFLKYGFSSNGIVANLIVPAGVAFVVALIVVVKYHLK